MSDGSPGSNRGAICSVAYVELRMRMRSTGFWALAAIFSLLTYMALPARSARYAFITAGPHGVFRYDSGFVGMVVGFISSLLFGLIGFFYAHNSLRRDRISPTGEVLAATQLSSTGYILGKYLAVICALTALLASSLVTGVIVQALRGEAGLAWDRLLSSASLLAVPTLLYTAGLGVAGGAIPVRGSGVGLNLLYVAYWFASLWGVMTISVVRTALWVDYTGFTVPSFEVARAYHASTVLGAAPSQLNLLNWPTLSTNLYLMPRLAYVLAGLALPFLSSVWFSRFDPDLSIRVATGRRVKDSR